MNKLSKLNLIRLFKSHTLNRYVAYNLIYSLISEMSQLVILNLAPRPVILTTVTDWSKNHGTIYL